MKDPKVCLLRNSSSVVLLTSTEDNNSIEKSKFSISPNKVPVAENNYFKPVDFGHNRPGRNLVSIKMPDIAS